MRKKRYIHTNHDIIFDEWWACKNCLAKGPELNTINCINPRHNRTEEDDDDDRHRHTRRKTEVTMYCEKIDDRSNGADLGVL
eukprot:8260031-Heterocapsa_arctica.AAC.1